MLWQLYCTLLSSYFLGKHAGIMIYTSYCTLLPVAIAAMLAHAVVVNYNYVCLY